MVTDCPKMRNLPKIFLRTFENVAPVTDVHEGVMADSRFYPQVTQNEDNCQAIGFC